MADLTEHLDEGTIHAWLDGALPPDQSSRVDAHAASCASCAATVAEARGLVAASSRILSALDGVPAAVIPGRAGGVDQLSALRARRVTATRRWWRHPQVLAAASLVFIAGTGTVVWRSLSQASSSTLVQTERTGAADAAASRPEPVTPPVVAGAPESQPLAARADAPPSLRDRPPVSIARRADSMLERKAEAISKVADSQQVAETRPVAAAAAPPTRQAVLPTAGVVQQALAPQAQQQTVSRALGQAGGSFAAGAREAARAANEADLAGKGVSGALVGGTPECYELRGLEPAGIRLLGVPDRVRLATTSGAGVRAEPVLRASVIGAVDEGVSLSARLVGGDPNGVELLVRRPLDSTIVRFTRSVVATPPALSATDAAAGVKTVSARRMVCPE